MLHKDQPVIILCTFHTCGNACCHQWITFKILSSFCCNSFSVPVHSGTLKLLGAAIHKISPMQFDGLKKRKATSFLVVNGVWGLSGATFASFLHPPSTYISFIFRLKLRSSKSSVQSSAAGHVVQNSSGLVARSVAAIWRLFLFKWSQLLSNFEKSRLWTILSLCGKGKW